MTKIPEIFYQTGLIAKGFDTPADFALRMNARDAMVISLSGYFLKEDPAAMAAALNWKLDQLQSSGGKD